MLTFSLGIKRVSQQWNIEYSSHSGSEMHGKNYVAVNTISSGNTPDTTENDEEKEEEETLDEDLQKPGNDGKEFEDCKNDRKCR